MPSGPRIRGNNSFGVTTDNPLTAGALTFNSAALPTLPAVTAAHAVVVLDSKRVFGEPEIVIVTSHAALATVATITRGAYGTVARSHPQGTVWGHVPIDEDYIEILTSSTRPTDPYRGQAIFETDTNKYVGRSTTDAWTDIVSLGPWIPWSPSWLNVTLGTGAQNQGEYIKVGRTVFFRAYLTLGTGGDVTGQVSVSLPVTAAATVFLGLGAPTVSIICDDATGAMNPGFAEFTTANLCRLFVIETAGAFGTRNIVTTTTPFDWTVGDEIRLGGFYEAAA